MNTRVTLIPATIAWFLVAVACLSGALAGEIRETVATTRDHSIPLWTSVRKPIPDEDWRQIASRYGLVFTLFSPKAGGKDLTSENERVRWIKSLNPRMTVLVYGSAINTANFPLHAWKKPREHDNWFLRDEAGKFVSNWTYTNSLHLDPGNPGWQDYVAETLEQYIDRYGYDGVFVDLVGSTPYYVNFKKTKKALNPKTGKAYTAAEWKQANLDMLRTIREHIGDKLMIVNSGVRGKSYFQTAYRDFFAYADGVCFEGFAGWYTKSLTNFGGENEWKADVDALVDCTKHGKVAFAVPKVSPPKGDESPRAHEQLHRYIAASFLLGTDNRHYLLLSTKLWKDSADSSPPLRDMFQALRNLSLGNSRGAYYRADGVYQRDFERGKVLVNPTKHDAKVGLQGTWHTDKGDPAVSPLPIPAHTGTILHRPT